MKISFTGWNAHSSRFVYAPRFEWECSTQVKAYRFRLADKVDVIVDEIVQRPYIDLNNV